MDSLAEIDTMERAGIQEFFDYTGWAWERIARVLDEQPPETFAKAVEGSGWPSIAACLTHFVAAYDGWLNGEWGKLQVGEMTYPGNWPEPVDDWQAMREYHVRVRESFRQALDVADDVLYAARNYEFEGETPRVITRADILANLVVHERGHHGDLNTLFHQLGIRSYYIDFGYFRSNPNDFMMDEGD